MMFFNSMVPCSATPRQSGRKRRPLAILLAAILACAATTALIAPAPTAQADGLERKKPRPVVKPKPVAPVAPRPAPAPAPAVAPEPEAPPAVITPISTDIRLSDGFFNGSGGVGAGIEGAGNSVVAGGSIFLNGSNRFSGIGGVTIVRTGFTFGSRSGSSGGSYGHGSGGRAG